MDWPALPQGREDCPRCAALEQRVRDLEQRLADLEDRLRANSSNSSNAPSTDRPWEPRYPKKKPTGRPPGKQKGRPGFGRGLLPPDQVDRVVEHRPAACDRCGAALPADAPPGDVTGRHQVAELPPRAVVITEHRSVACACPNCGRRVRGTIPPEVRGSCTGPRLTAAVCYLAARVHGSRRAVGELLGELLGSGLSLGGVVNKEAEMAGALEAGYAHVRDHVAAAGAKHVDETGWALRGEAYWLWTAATGDAAVFRVDRCRNVHALRRLIGDDRGLLAGTLCTDRFGVYDHVKVERRQLCWAHLKRDFQRFADRGGGSRGPGDEGLAITAEVCRLFGRFRDRKMKRRQLQRRLAPVRRRTRALLERGIASGVGKLVHFCRHLQKRWRALWTFARVDGIGPTNNHAERVLRPAVTWRKASFGCASDAGCRFVERVLTAVHTCRLRGRSVLDYLADTIDARRRGLPTPAIV